MYKLIKRDFMEAAEELYGDCASPLEQLKLIVRDELEISEGVVGDNTLMYNTALSDFKPLLDDIEEYEITKLEKLYVDYLDRFNNLHYEMLEEVKQIAFVQYVRTLYDIQNALFEVLNILEEGE